MRPSTNLLINLIPIAAMNQFTPDHRVMLDQSGYCLFENFMPSPLLNDLRSRVAELYDLEGDAAGSEFKTEPGAKRLANCVDKGEVFQRCIQMPVMLDAVAAVLGAEFKLSSLNVRTALPFPESGTESGNEGQPLHCDMGATPDQRGYWVCNVVWMMDDFTIDNGPTRAVPGTHKLGRLPDTRKHADEVLITGKAGTICVMNAHLWHGGAANLTLKSRTALHSFFCRRDKPQQQYQKQLLRPATQAALSPALRHLLALDDAHNDAVSANVAVRSGFMK